LKRREFLFATIAILCCLLMVSDGFIGAMNYAPQKYQTSLTSTTTQHTPLLINHNDNFTSFGMPGNGSLDNPFRIEKFSISATGTAINITGTSDYVIIQDCILTQLTDTDAFGVYLQNVSNCYVIGCDIEVRYWGVYLSDCQNCGVSYCNISSNPFDVNFGIAIYFESCNYSIANDNFVNGQGTIGTGIVVGNASRWCTTANNTITGVFGSAVYIDAIGCRVSNNTIMQSVYGIYLTESSENNTITLNRFKDNFLRNSLDDGVDNIWNDNWYSDYIGFGPYFIPGTGLSVDHSPQPQNAGLLVTVVLIPTIVSILILIGLWKRFRQC